MGILRWHRRVGAVFMLCTSAVLGCPSIVLAGAASGARVTASSTTAGDASSVADGDPVVGRLGTEWAASPTDPNPWVQVAWSASHRIASIQVFGSTASAFDPRQSTAAALYGTLRFSDGSSVTVPGIAPGSGMPTTVAFAPRETTFVKLELRRQISTAAVALREFTAYDAGVTPPRWSPASTSATYSAVPPAAVCPAKAPSLAASQTDRLTLACPTPGASITDTAVVSLNAPPGTSVVAWASWPGPGGRTLPLRRVAIGAADGEGRVTLTADVRRLLQGPFSLKVTATDSAGRRLVPFYVQLFHSAGTVSPAGTGSNTPSGMTLQYVDDFDGPLSISQTGWGTDYAAVKPERWGGSQFGEAVFADPAWGAGTLATLPGGYLRIRAQDIGQYTAKQTWKQAHIAGILSSQRFGGSGFSAQYGYFEARILGAPGPGAWPAFWMMNSESGTGRTDGTSGEIDATELYGHDTRKSCSNTHAWGSPALRPYALCQAVPAAGDWAAEWHTYGVRVLPGGAEFFIDGKRMATLDQLSHTDEPFFFMLNLATGGGWPVDLSATGQTADMYVDWVRVST